MTPAPRGFYTVDFDSRQLQKRLGPANNTQSRAQRRQRPYTNQRPNQRWSQPTNLPDEPPSPPRPESSNRNAYQPPQDRTPPPQSQQRSYRGRSGKPNYRNQYRPRSPPRDAVPEEALDRALLSDLPVPSYLSLLERLRIPAVVEKEGIIPAAVEQDEDDSDISSSRGGSPAPSISQASSVTNIPEVILYLSRPATCLAPSPPPAVPLAVPSQCGPTPDATSTLDKRSIELRSRLAIERGRSTPQKPYQEPEEQEEGEITEEGEIFFIPGFGQKECKLVEPEVKVIFLLQIRELELPPPRHYTPAGGLQSDMDVLNDFEDELSRPLPSYAWE
ncbi:hypothetical protein D9613_006474 [Agrocybe pediades]|uniref:Uncharacterized protein n=1 Tax=Agrocybe pediades TaxID=84607 RepID=A0A8H4VIM5_9AGAR|nr:hypothetical protein D9613_006474 [Agrocybe pediades]